ncbi:MAG: hypothetical protein ACXVK4_12000 [Acidimicrobiia bacterium]
MRRTTTALLVVLAVAGAACVPLDQPADTTRIQLVGTTSSGGWTYETYRDLAYPCAISGFQTFVIGTKDGSSASAARPLFTLMHGGGVGYFDEQGKPVPGPGQKVEEGGASLINRLDNNGLLGKVRDDPAGFRTLAVSYCSHDLYGGSMTPDPHNPYVTPDGGPRFTNGLISTKAAIQFATAKYPTTATFLLGGSAGSAGTFGVAWALQQQGIPPTGVIADASIVNVEAFAVGNANGICTDTNSGTRVTAVAARIHPDLANVDNEPDKLVSSGRLTVPLLHIWNHGDHNTCGAPPVACPLRDGTALTMGYTDCIHEPMRRAIAAEGPDSRSENLPLCVDDDPTPDCSVHVVTSKPGLVNTDPQSPADYLTAIMDWVHARLADA